MTILFLLTNYYNEIEVETFVTKQINREVVTGVEIIITNNGSKNVSILNALNEKFKNVKVLHPSINLGYFGAAHFALQSYLKENNNELPNAVIVCNSDISFNYKNFIEDLKHIIQNKNADIIGPSIFAKHLNIYQNPYIINRLPKNRIRFYNFISSNFIFYSAFTMLHFIKKRILSKRAITLTDKSKVCYAVHGSFMVFNQSYFKKGGTLHYPSFLFGEEIFVAETALKLNLKTVFDPSLKIIHHQHSTTGKIKSRKYVQWMHQSYSYLLKNFFK
jgi:GT2 family glycosyltransferase